MPVKPPRLWHFRISHYNEKVRWGLDFKRWPHVRQAVVPGFHIPRVRLLTGQNLLPALELDGAIMVGSAAILEELERRRPDPPLFPAEPAARARAVALCAYFDDQVAPDLRRLFWSPYLARPADCARMATDGFSRITHWVFRAAYPFMRSAFHANIGAGPDQLAQAQARLGGHFARLEAELGPSGYLVGNSFGVADLTAAAIMTAIIRPPQFSYALPEPWPPALAALRASVAERPGFRWVLDVYARHRGTSCAIVDR